MPTFEDVAASTHAIPPNQSPTTEEAAKAKALINFLMQDRFFLALHRSNDPKERAAAMNKLNKAHHQAYGDVPTKDDDAGGAEVAPTLVPRRKVMTENSFGIPQSLREVSEQNLKQAHAAYELLTDFEDKTVRVGMAAMPSPLAAAFKDVRERAMDFAMENAESACTFAIKVSNAKTPQEILTLQTRFAQDGTQTFVKNTQDLYGLIGETVQ